MNKRKYQTPRCDSCDLFVTWYPEEVGGSSRFIPDSHFTIERVERRCKKCTEKYGDINLSSVSIDFWG